MYVYKYLDLIKTLFWIEILKLKKQFLGMLLANWGLAMDLNLIVDESFKLSHE